MGHYAKIVDNKVVKVIVATQDFIENYNDGEPELNLYPSSWVKTSYNTRGGVHYEPNTNTPSENQSKSLRKNYAGVGFIYNAELDAFYAPQPYPSWNLNEVTCLWEPPVEYPNDGRIYTWGETTTSWTELNIE